MRARFVIEISSRWIGEGRHHTTVRRAQWEFCAPLRGRTDGSAAFHVPKTNVFGTGAEVPPGGGPSLAYSFSFWCRVAIWAVPRQARSPSEIPGWTKSAVWNASAAPKGMTSEVQRADGCFYMRQRHALPRQLFNYLGQIHGADGTSRHEVA